MSDQKPFQMPAVYVGEIVLFFNEGMHRGVPAVVTNVGDGSISIQNLEDRDRFGAVRHRSDPGLEKMDDKFKTSWEYTGFGKFVRGVKEPEKKPPLTKTPENKPNAESSAK